MMMTAGRLVERIEALSPYKPEAKTVDRIVIGDSATVVTGVVSSFMPTFEVLRKMAAMGANFLITHEPTFFNHHDELADWADDEVVRAKREWIEEHGLVVYRYHDMPHRVRPDMIMRGIAEQLAWPQVERDERDRPVVRIAPTRLGELVKQMKQRLGATTIRYAGDAEQVCATIGFRVGSPGPGAEADTLRDPKVDVMMIGEGSEWSSGEYVRDAMANGRKVALILLGHRNSEDAGMAWISRWMSKQLNMRIEHLAVRDPFAVAE